MKRTRQEIIDEYNDCDAGRRRCHPEITHVEYIARKRRVHRGTQPKITR